jgi:putative ABC transport system substrate-binding protein
LAVGRACTTAGAQHRVPRVRHRRPLLLQAFRQGLPEHGWIEGENIIIHYRFAEGRDDRLSSLADELVRLKMDVIVVSPTAPALAAKNATEAIPIVGIGFDNPLERGLIASLARTGLAYGAGPEIFGKDLELLRQLVPDIRHVAVLSNRVNPNHAAMISQVETAARSLGMDLLLLDARGPVDFDTAFAAMAKNTWPRYLFSGTDVFYPPKTARRTCGIEQVPVDAYE